MQKQQIIKLLQNDDDLTQSGNDYKTKSSKINDIDVLILDYKIS